MSRHCHHRAGHYVLLLAVAGVLCLLNLGGPSLWDIDEGHNAEAAREMFESGNWVVPTFNFQLRVDKPALLYWLQMTGYRFVGVNEFAARLPSALAALLTILLTYELGRRQFDPATGLLAGLILASTLLFCAAAHFANPDALLCALTTLNLVIFWNSFASGGRGWFVPTSVVAGLAVLAKGPVGVVLPLGVTSLFLLWSGRLRLLLDRRFLYGCLVFLLVALPWYIYVGAETKMEFLRGFLQTHNVGRFTATMENHQGPFYYYVLCLVAGFAPWSAFFGPALWYGLVRTETSRSSADGSAGWLARLSAWNHQLEPAYRFLWSWILLYVVFFSMSATKLPNYILPVYPAVAILTGRFLERWRSGALTLHPWWPRLTLAGFGLVGMIVFLGLLLAGGIIETPLLRGRYLPGVERWGVVGLVPIIGAAGAAWCLRRQLRTGMVAVVTLSAMVLLAALAAGGSMTVDDFKAPRPLVQVCQAWQTVPEIRMGCFGYYQPSLVFYSGREVLRLPNEEKTLEFLRYPMPVYLFVPEGVWHKLKEQTVRPARVLGRHPDVYQHCQVLVVTNR